MAASSSTSSATAAGNTAPAATSTTVVLEGEEARHAARALRLQAGDCLELCDGRGYLVQGIITATDKQRVWVSPNGPATYQPWVGPRWVVAVACTTLKGGRSEWMIEKLAELGAYQVVPLVTERSQSTAKSKFKTREPVDDLSDSGSSSGSSRDRDEPGRLERVAIAATKQCLRAHALRLSPPTPLPKLLPLLAEQQQQPGGCSLVAVAGAPPLAHVLRELNFQQQQQQHRSAATGQTPSPRSGNGAAEPGASGGGIGASGDGLQAATARGLRVLLVGPEGDFTPGELAGLVAVGARPVGLGHNRLRTETAAVGLLAACIFAA